MGKPKKQRGAIKYNYDINRKRLWKKSKKLPAIQCKEIKDAWDNTKSVNKNLAEMGLSTDPNKTLRIKTTKELLTPMEVDVSDIKKIRAEEKAKAKARKQHVVDALEEDANKPLAKTNKLSKPEVMFCTYMIDKYGDDFKAMARDSKNHYQETPKQLKKKINMFMNTPGQYEEYLKSKVLAVCESVVPLCLSPVTPSDTCIPPCRHSDRRVTRKYEAARRNGHYTLSPEQLPEAPATGSPPVSLSRVRRKLHFGRLPPRNRHLDDQDT